jgi:hypothetical protein
MADNRTGFENLKEDFPIFIVENKTNITKHIVLADNHDVPIPGLTKRPIESANLIQMPNSKFFRMINPDIPTLVAYGLIKVAASAEPTVAPTSPSAASDNTSNK